MGPDDYANVEQVLELVTAEMAVVKKPKVLLFDIGGVCVSEFTPKIVAFIQSMILLIPQS